MENDALELVRAFVNTRDLEEGTDELATPDELEAWLTARGLLERAARATAGDVHRAAAMREALRAHLLANNDAQLAEDAPAVLERQARRSRLAVGFDQDGVELRPRAAGVDGALGRILGAAASAMADGSWTRLKACRADGCRWAFVDRSRNGSRHWCAMRVCGNREKVRSFRARRAASAEG